MTETITVPLCPQCGALDSIERARLEAASDEHQDGGVFRCRVCHWEFGVWLDAGELDLGLVRESADASSADAWIYRGPEP